MRLLAIACSCLLVAGCAGTSAPKKTNVIFPQDNEQCAAQPELPWC